MQSHSSLVQWDFSHFVAKANMLISEVMVNYLFAFMLFSLSFVET